MRCRWSPQPYGAKVCIKCQAPLGVSAEELKRANEPTVFSCAGCKREFRAPRKDVVDKAKRNAKCITCGGVFTFPADIAAIPAAAPAKAVVAMTTCPICDASTRIGDGGRAQCGWCLISFTNGVVDRKRDGAPIEKAEVAALFAGATEVTQPLVRVVAMALAARADRGELTNKDAQRLVTALVGLLRWRRKEGEAELPVDVSTAQDLVKLVLFESDGIEGDSVRVVLKPPTSESNAATLIVANVVGLGLLAATGTGFLLRGPSETELPSVDALVKIVPRGSARVSLEMTIDNEVGLNTSMRGLLGAAGRAIEYAGLSKKLEPLVWARRQSMVAYLTRVAVVGFFGVPALRATDAHLRARLGEFGVDVQFADALKIAPRIAL